MLNKYKEILEEKKEVYLRAKVRPNANKTELIEVLDDDTIKIDICAVPEKNKANLELINFLAKEFKVNKKNISIISGKAERLKLVKINNNLIK